MYNPERNKELIFFTRSRLYHSICWVANGFLYHFISFYVFYAQMFYNKKFYILLSLLIATLALYCYNPFAFYFQNDDFIHIPLSQKGVLLQHNTFRPVCDISIMLDYWLWGKSAWGYHLTNLLLHIFTC